MVGIFALMVIFVATLILCACKVPPERARLKRFVVDLLGGMVLPMLCLAYDPIVFRDGPSGAIGIGYTQSSDTDVIVQMLALVAWMTVGWWFTRWRPCFPGFLFVGAIVSGFIGVLLAFFSLIGLLFYGIGMLGFTPFLTCAVFSRNASSGHAASHCNRRQADVRAAVSSGRVLAVAIPASIYWTAGPWIEHVIKLIPWPHSLPGEHASEGW